jgi:hypothetical protein
MVERATITAAVVSYHNVFSEENTRPPAEQTIECNKQAYEDM